MAKAAAEKKPEKKPLTKTQMVAEIATVTELTKKQVNDVLEALSEEIKKSMGKKGAGSFTLPGLLKIEKKHVKAQPAKKNVPNPLRPGEFINREAKPAHYRVKIKALKGLKETV
ncbi:MAG: HU family DNA-binding protein [Thermoguttaceae bacterium]